ncbi:MAG: hypothetical protein ACUVT0_11550, partial [Thermochromatium sp.]
RWRKLRSMLEATRHLSGDMVFRETLKKLARGMECKAFGAQRPRHIKEIDEERQRSFGEG